MQSRFSGAARVGIVLLAAPCSLGMLACFAVVDADSLATGTNAPLSGFCKDNAPNVLCDDFERSVVKGAWDKQVEDVGTKLSITDYGSLDGSRALWATSASNAATPAYLARGGVAIGRKFKFAYKFRAEALPTDPSDPYFSLNTIYLGTPATEANPPYIELELNAPAGHASLDMETWDANSDQYVGGDADFDLGAVPLGRWNSIEILVDLTKKTITVTTDWQQAQRKVTPVPLIPSQIAGLGADTLRVDIGGTEVQAAANGWNVGVDNVLLANVP